MMVGPVIDEVSGPGWLLSVPAGCGTIALEFWELMPDRILVVDDEEAIREIVSSMLTFAGYSCLQAASGIEALAVLNSGEEFELMLSDLIMADLAALRLLPRTTHTLPHIPVL